MSLAELMNSSYETTQGNLALAEMIAPDRLTVFVAYPMDFTFVCTRQLCNYRDHWDELSGLNVRWWGINQAPLDKHLRFKEQKNIPFELVTDPDGRLLQALGLWGLLRTKRGFAAVSPRGELLGSSAIFPFFYQKHDAVVRLLEPYIAQVQPA